ncbi:hypothetical protein [Fredinandcohnia sp. 179-A 10B2 NHS]|uniref:hypothetical protein n=1 Tax=Fredinandcohnia sp. 179-A 10B2 NHS TaxID=3235176 RepID=UPI00399F1951
MNKNWIARIGLALALLLTVYNFFIVDTPDKTATGLILVLLIGVNVPNIVKK